MNFKQKIIFLFSVFYLFIISINGADAAARKYFIIRVRVIKAASSFDLTVKGQYTISALHTGDVLSTSRRGLVNAGVTPTKSGIKIDDNEYPLYGVRVIPTVGASVYIDKKQFRGVIDIIRTKSMKLMVINHIDIEDYLYGVLYYETPHYWPMETLQAQAIAARTYAVYKAGEMKDADYDLTNDSYSQMYGGKAGERWRTKWAVDLTKNKILRFKGKVLPAFYHSTCGGYTEDAKQLWGIDLKPLKGRKCDFCKKSKAFNWKAIYSYKQIEERLNKYGIKCNGISYIIEGPRDRSGRPETIKIRDKNGVKSIDSNKFRMALGAQYMKSTKFTIEITQKGIIFKGEGWGHGVGMCQWGAFGMAQRGYDHKDILDFYYPGATIEDIHIKND